MGTPCSQLYKNVMKSQEHSPTTGKLLKEPNILFPYCGHGRTPGNLFIEYTYGSPMVPHSQLLSHYSLNSQSPESKSPVLKTHVVL